MSEATEPFPEHNQAQVIKKLQKDQKEPITSPHKTIQAKTYNKLTSEYDNEICHKLNNKVESMNITTNSEKPIHLLKNATGLPAKTIINKSILYHVPNDETVRKFTTGDVIVDKKNPFKRNNDIDSGKLKKNSLPLIPTKRSTLSTLRSAHILKNKALKEDPEFITTEEVLKQSKYVKTYVKNPDKYFAFDPNVLATIKFDEWKEFSGNNPPKKVKHLQHTEERRNDLNRQFTLPANALIIPNFKKVSKPKYPDLSDIKVKVGTDLKDSLFNPDEVAKNAKKFDERVKKLCIGSDDELDDIEETLTKSDSCEEVKLINREGNTDEVDSVSRIDVEVKSFTNTVNSREFQEFLKKKGLLLTHRSEGLKPNAAKPNKVFSDPSPVHIVIEKKFPTEQIYSDPTPVMETQKKPKKTSVFHRLLPNGIFSSKRKTTPKQQVPIPQSLYGSDNTSSKNGGTKTSTAIKRVVLERQSFHGKEGNVFSSASAFKNQMERSRKSYASGDDRRSSFSSALTIPMGFVHKEEKNPGNVRIEERSKINRCQASPKDKFHTPQTRDGLFKAQLQRDQIPINLIRSTNGPNKCLEKSSAERQQAKVQQTQRIQLWRSVTERQSLAPKRTTTHASNKIQIIGLSSSMDGHETCKRNVSRIYNSLPKSKIVSSTLKNGLTPKNSNENLVDGGRQLTSTPIKECLQEQKLSAQVPKPSISLINASTESVALSIGLDQQKWGKLKEIKERTDRDLYSKVIQQAESRMVHSSQMEIEGHPHDPENIYERLPNVQEQIRRTPPYQPQIATECKPHNFIRGLAQRNTFFGTYQNRSAATIARNTVIPNERQVNQLIRSRNENVHQTRCQSVLDEMTTALKRERGYRSDSETPVIMRKQNHSTPRSGTLSREEILQKVKEFCRKSINKTPTKFGGSGQIIPEQISSKLTNDLSSVSLVSVGTHNRPSSRIAAPQVPQRIQSLPVQQLTPITIPTHTTSPIYAHVIKQNSIKTNVSDQFESPQRRACSSADYYNWQPRRLVAQSSETDSGVFGRADTASPVRFSIMDVEKMAPARLIKYGQYGQVQIPSPYGYIRINSQQHSYPRTDGRVTPLILERGSQVGSQIYWTPTRTIERHPLPPNYLSPCYAPQAQQHISKPKDMADSAVQPNPNIQDQQNVNVVYVKSKEHLFRSMNNYTGTNQLRSQSTIHSEMYESESGSEAGEVQCIMETQWPQEDWQNEKSGRNQSIEQVSDDRRRNARREDPRRHTLGGDMLQYGVSGVGVGGSGINLGSAGGGIGAHGQPQQRAMDLENQPMRGYAPINQGPLFDEDPGIMSEVETASTGFRRGGKQRSSLPVVRTPSKTLERPLGLVFLQYRSETKRALLPNEITSIDTVRALFVRSFPRQLTMAYLEGPNVKIYIHDASKDMFYELEDVRSHLREIRDRSVLRLFESNEVAAPPQVLPGGPGIPQPLPQSQPTHWDQDQSYFSEPEFDSEYQHQHIHKSKGGKQAPYYVGASQTLPRGMYSERNKAAAGAPAKPLRSYGSRGSMGPPFPYPPDQLYSIPDGYSSSPERGQRGSYEEPYYSQYGTRGQNVAPIIDEEHGEVALSDDQYALYGMKMGPGRIPRTANQVYDPTRPEDLHRIRVEHMERQLANLTGLVQKALVNQNPQIAPAVSGLNPNYLGVPSQCRGLDDIDDHSSGSSTSIQDKSVSFEKSVSFSDDIQGVQKSHSPQHAADSKPPKPAIKSSTLPRTSSQAERDRLKPPPPPKPLALATTHPTYRADIALAPEVYNHLRGLQKKAKDLRMEVRTLRRLSQAQAVAVREDIKDAFMRIRATLLASSGNYWGQGDQEKTRMSREEELYKQEVIRLEKDLSDLESSVEGLRGEVINRRTRVNMAAVEDMALVLSRASKTVAELKMRFPGLQNGLRNILSSEMEKVVREEKFLKEEPDRLESALRRCKKLTGTLVTLKRLASVQEQRLPVNETSTDDAPRSADMSSTNKPIPSPRLGTVSVGGGIPPENALDALLDELQTFAKPLNQNNDLRPDDSTSDDSSQAIHSTVTTQLSQASLYTPGELQSQLATAAAAIVTGTSNTLHVNSNIGSLRRLHSYPSGSDTDTSPPQPIRPMSKPPVPERNADLLSKVGNKRIPPPPPPRTSSRSPLASPTSPNIPQHLPSLNESEGDLSMGNGDNSGNSSGNESGNDHVQRQLALEVRHQELLKKQKMLQEQYARLQKLSKNSVTLPPSDIMLLKKTGSESNLPQKMGLNMSVTGSMKNLNTEINVSEKNEKNLANNVGIVDLVGNGATRDGQPQHSQTTTTSKVYETDIL